MSVFIGLMPLVLAGLIPAVAVSGPGPQTLYLAPLLGALVSALAAVSEFVVGPGITVWFAIWATAANIAALSVLRRGSRRPGARRRGPGERAGRPRWAWVAGLIPALACVWPLTALRVPLVGYDTRAIWILHAMFIYGGHHQFHADVTNPAYLFSNPDYPPLQPAASALAFAMNGRVDSHLAVIVTAVLNAAALGLVSMAVVEAAGRARTLGARTGAWIGAGTLCLAGFGIAGQYAVNGYADLLWAAAASAAVMYGLVLPRSGHALAVAWAAGTVAALTKNEGLIAAAIIFALMALRYVDARRRERPDGRGVGVWAGSGPWSLWPKRVLLAAILAFPGLLWAAVVKLEGVGSAFFSNERPGSVSSRLGATASHFWTFLHILPLAAAVLVAGALLLRGATASLGLGNPLWVWGATCAWLVALAYTYVFGSFDIEWWLRNSADRTLIFPQLVVIALLTVWGVSALEAVGSRSESHSTPRVAPRLRSPEITEPVTS